MSSVPITSLPWICHLCHTTQEAPVALCDMCEIHVCEETIVSATHPKTAHITPTYLLYSLPFIVEVQLSK